MSEIKAKILETIHRLQNDPATAGIYDPEITGQGVTIWALSGEFKEINPKVLSEKRPCLTPCSPSDWRKGGKCDQNGCYHP